MLKIVFRVVVILLVAVLLSAGLYLLVQHGSSATVGNAPNFRGGGGDFGHADFGNRGSRGSASLGRGLGGVFVTLLQIGLVTFIVTMIQRALSESRRVVSR